MEGSMTNGRALLRLCVAVTALGGSGCTYATVGAGEVGVVWTPQGKPQVLPEGQWNIGFWDRTTVYNTRSLEREERLEVLAANGLRIVLDTSIRYHILAAEALELDHDLGAEYYAVLVGPVLRSQARRVIGRYQPEEIYSTQREMIERQVREGVEAAIKGRHVVLEGVLIRNVTLPESIQMAINDKLQAEQAALKMKFVIAQAEEEARKQLMQVKAQTERDRIEALARAELAKIEAQSAAEAKRIDAQATDEFQRLVQQHMTDKVLEWQRIAAFKALAAAPNSKVILLGGNTKTGTLLDLK
jgi:regulator of protease activity HflC (stomatin/prohibitin superfamily)